MREGSMLRRMLGVNRTDPVARRRRTAEGKLAIESLEERWMLSGSGRGLYSASPGTAWTISPNAPANPQPFALSPATAPNGRIGIARAMRRRLPQSPPADPSVVGAWTPPLAFRPPGARGAFLAIHMTLLPNGMVLTWPHDYNYFLSTKHAAPYNPGIMLWNPATNQYIPLPILKSNIFCSGSTFLPNGDLVVLGGHGPAAVPVSGLQTHYGNDHVEIFDFRTQTWWPGPSMSEGRYYGSAITLGTGEILAVAGFDEDGGNNPLIEIYKDGQGWRTLPAANTAAFPDWYPNIYQLSTGLVFGTIPGNRTFFLNPQGSGVLVPGPSLNYPRRYDGTTVMYAPDQILAIGGNAARGLPPASGSSRQITNTAETINLDSPNPTWQYTGSMHSARFLLNATLLPDGTVLATGGTTQQDNNNGNALAGAVYSAELWDPKTGQWSLMSSMSVPRLYHSTAILLPDGRVLVAGGGQPESTGEAKGTTHQNMQIFSPPYLFRGPRPVIASAPGSASYGSTVAVTTPDAASISRITLVRPGSTTHGFNMTQRIEEIPFQKSADGQTLQLQLPANPNLAPPGYYMLFLLNNLGVPSTASFIRLGS